MDRTVKPILVVDYDPEWPARFERLRALIQPALGEVVSRIEHVGSTAVPGLTAKPIIDLDVVVSSLSLLPLVIERLDCIGYVHEGDLGIEARQAFRAPSNLPAHHLYVCPEGSPALANHLAVRDRLRSDPELAREYGRLKRSLAQDFARDSGAYVEGKTQFLLSILRAAGFHAGPDGTLLAP
jgi:GrpB-like predicted nucleotidyltransferase (UPF0157 family)